jgi:hypothetical protein
MAEDRPVDRDWGTGVVVAPGAKTWTADSYKQKQGLINETAMARGKSCSHYAFIGWPSAAGDIQELLATTRKSYETDGWSVTQAQGDIATDTIWTVRRDGREAVILWGGVMGSTIYLSCLTAGSPPSDPIQTLIGGILLAIGLGCLGAGLWLIRRARSNGGFSVVGVVLAGVGAAALAAVAALLLFVG